MSEVMARHVELQVILHQEDGMYWAEVLSHPGLFASGETMDGLIQELGEAWALYAGDEEVKTSEAVHPAPQTLSVLVPA
jgi:predicted RNase H-like HicB family nuclease